MRTVREQEYGMALRQGNPYLTADQVADIRKGYAEGLTQRELAANYKMSVVQIGRIVRGESWAKQIMRMPSSEEVNSGLLRMIAVQREVDDAKAKMAESMQKVREKDKEGDKLLEELTNGGNPNGTD